MADLLPKVFEKQDKRSILRYYSLFLVSAAVAFLTLTLLFLIPQIDKTIDGLQSNSEQGKARAYASKLDRYLEDRVLALNDMAENPLIISAVMLAEGDRPDFKDYTSHALLLGEDPALTVLDVRGDIVYTEIPEGRQFDWAFRPLMDEANKIVQIVEGAKYPKFDMAVPIFYGRGREGVLIARINGAPEHIYDADLELSDLAGVKYAKGNVSITSDVSNIENPFQSKTRIDDFGVDLTYVSSRVPVVARKKELIRGVIFSVLVAGLLALALLYALGRKIIVAPYLDLAVTKNAIAESVEGIAQFDRFGNYLTVNAAYAGAAGYTPEELVGMSSEMTNHSEDLPMLVDAYNTMISEGKVTIDTRGIKKDGSDFYAQLTMIPNYNEKNELIGHFCFQRDSTQKRLADKEREQLVDKLLSSNEELERFAYVCSHDLQEPLRMIRSFSEKLQVHIADDLKDDEKGQRYFNFVIDGAKRAQSLITDILAYSGLDKDTKPLEEISLNGIVNSIREPLEVDAEDLDVELTADDLPEIIGNKTQIYQLFQNLINNGLKYQQADAAPKVHISVHDNGELWQFAVRDNGIGIDARHIHKIFGVFQRLHRRTEYAGTGVGLSICKKIVERHGGSIWVVSEKGQGSIFYFTILKSTNKDIQNGKITQAN